MRPLAALLLLLLASCSSTIGDSPAGTPDGRPITFRSPPESKVGSGTAPGCDGVAARGECRDGTLVFCDLEVGKARKVDCTATGESCIESVSRGAACTGHGERDPSPTATQSPCSTASVSEVGFCTAEGEAKYCDTTGESPKVVVWKCADNNKTCIPAGEPGACAEGAFCCGDEQATQDCGSLDYSGLCDGEVAKWCGGDGIPREMDCAATEQRCETDTCASGAYCCGESEESAAGCNGLGYAGECTGTNSLKYCNNGEVDNIACSSGRTCQVNVCGTGATCCVADEDTTPAPGGAECLELGFDGICISASTMRYCSGDTDADIREFTCATTHRCQVGVCGVGALCCEDAAQQDQCAEVDGPTGICSGNTLKYCSLNVYKEIDCSASGKWCETNTCLSGMANCCE